MFHISLIKLKMEIPESKQIHAMFRSQGLLRVGEIRQITNTQSPVVQEGAVEEDFIALIKHLFLLFFTLKR